MLAIGPQQVRAVTHLDVDRAATQHAAEIIVEVARSKPAGKVAKGSGLTYA